MTTSPHVRLDQNDEDLNQENAGPRRTEVFRNYGATTISDGDWVIIDLVTATASQIAGEGNACLQSTTTANLFCLGVADEDIPAGESGSVVVYGVKQKAAAVGGVSKGDLLTSSGATAGACATATVGTHHVIGQALENSAAGVADVFVMCG